MHEDIKSIVLDCRTTTVRYPSFSERMRPRNFDELLLPDETIVKLKKMVASRSVMNMIFYGNPGTGKTTCAELIANSVDFEMLYLNASIDNSINDIRDTVQAYTTAMSLYQATKIVILDESDYLSTSAQASLRSLIEKSVSNCRFILTVNQLSRIQDPLRSRCKPVCFDFAYLSINESIAKLTLMIKRRLTEINAEIDESRLRQIVVMKFPDYRAIANDIEFELL